LWLGGAVAVRFLRYRKSWVPQRYRKKRDIYGRVYRHLMENSWMIDI